MANSQDTNTPWINILPTEILRDIFVLSYLTVGRQECLAVGLLEPTHYRITISSVSKRWYSLVLEEPRLWSEIAILIEHVNHMYKLDQAILRLAALCLSRSKSAPLQLSIELFNMPEESQHQVKRLVFPHLHRCRSLRFQFYQGKHTHPVDPLKIWFPLPDIPSLNHLDIFLSSELPYDGEIIHLGPALTLRTFRLTITESHPIFHSKFAVTDELCLVGLHDERSVFNVLQHCTNVKVLTLRHVRLLLPFSQSLSFPALVELNVKNILEFPLQAAPNLRCLRVERFWDDRINHIPDIMQVPSGLRELFWDGLGWPHVPDLGMLYSVGSGCFVRSKGLEVIHVSHLNKANDWAQFLTPSVSPSPRSPSVAGYQQAGNSPGLPFPGLKLFVVGPYKYRMESLEPLRNLLQARPDLVSVYRWQDSCPPCAKRLSDLMPNRFITSESSKAEKLIEDLKRDLMYGTPS